MKGVADNDHRDTEPEKEAEGGSDLRECAPSLEVVLAVMRTPENYSGIDLA